MTERPDQRTEQSAALVLRAVDYGESDRVVTLLTRDHGRVSTIARAARKSKRRFAGALEGFALIHVEYTQGRGALARLDIARVTRVFPRLLANLSALDAAGALMRLARDLLPERAPEPDVFDSLLEALELLDAGASPRAVRLCCEARLLAVTGFAPMLQACVSCGREPSPTRLALFDAARGGIVCRACGGGLERMPARVRALLQSAMEGATLQDAVDGATLPAAGDRVSLGAAGDGVPLGAAGDRVPLGAADDRVPLGAMGDRLPLAAVEEPAPLTAAGDDALLGAANGASLRADASPRPLRPITDGTAPQAVAGMQLEDGTLRAARDDAPSRAEPDDSQPYVEDAPLPLVPRSAAPAALGGMLPEPLLREAERLLSLFITQLLQREHKRDRPR